MQAVVEKLTENMQVIYRKAIDADQALTKLQQSGKGKFSNIFAADAGFSVESKRFMPYVEELAKDIARLPQDDQSAVESALPDIVRKMEQLFVTLAHFQQSLTD